ncbi:MAG: hypothetical protein JXR91_05530 [Deltaproteobacteria bacterium]|nr:hypothetical protein [Deltaproteobacteria bacterium]
MPKNKVVKYLILIISLVFYLQSGCSKTSQKSDEKAVAPPLKLSKPSKKTTTLDWELIKPGISQEKFIEQLSKMADIDLKDATDMVKCGFQPSIGVIDPEHLKIRNMTSKSSDLTFCTFFETNLNRSWVLASARAVFKNKKLAAINYRFKKDYYEVLLSQLEKRLNKGDSRELSDETSLAPVKTSSILWKTENRVWALSASDHDISLKLEDSNLIQQLVIPGKSEELPKTKLGIDDKNLEVDLSDI